MKPLARKALAKAHLLEAAQGLVLWLRQNVRRLRGIDRAILDDYLSGHAVKKLHIGCGKNLLSGWLNSDYVSSSRSVLQLDATGVFPLADATLDYAWSEHMIEHISHDDGVAMLHECHRVLKNGGRIRIATPDLQFLVELHRADKSPVQREYIQWSTDNFITKAPYPGDAFVINNFFRDWGHMFIYDEKTLRAAMERAGFVDVTRCELNESTDPELRGLENEQRMPAGFLRLESLILEGTKRSGEA